MASVEGTGCNGEDELNEESEFVKWMLANGAKRTLIKILVENEYDTIDILRQLKGNNDEIKEVANELNLKRPQRLHLQSIIEKIPSNTLHIVDKEEREAILSIDKKLKSIHESVEMIKNTKNNIDEEIKRGQELIEKSFEDISKSLNERKISLIKQLKQVGTDKKAELDKQHEILRTNAQSMQQKSSECHQLLRKSLELEQIEERRQTILNAAKGAEDIEIIQKDDSLIANYKINIECDVRNVIDVINRFGVISSIPIPILVSLKDNGDLSVAVAWKLNKNQQQNQNVNDTKIKIECTQNEYKDDGYNDDMKLDWSNNKIFNIKENDKNGSTINLKLSKANTNYLFRVLYFSSKQWSKSSNVKSVFIKAADSWDPNCKGDNITINGKSVEITNMNQKSAYLTRVISEGIHVWTFKIDKFKSGYQMIGVWKTKHNPCVDGWIGGESVGGGSDKCYAYIFDRGNKFGAGKHVNWGISCKIGDTIEMTLNLIDLSLSYKVNDRDLGKAFENIEQTSYKVAATLYTTGTKFTLLSYECRSQ